MTTLIIIRCSVCKTKHEYEGEYHPITMQIHADGWRHWDRKTGLATCRVCAEKEKGS